MPDFLAGGVGGAVKDVQRPKPRIEPRQRRGLPAAAARTPPTIGHKSGGKKSRSLSPPPKKTKKKKGAPPTIKGTSTEDNILKRGRTSSSGRKNTNMAAFADEDSTEAAILAGRKKKQADVRDSVPSPSWREADGRIKPMSAAAKKKAEANAKAAAAAAKTRKRAQQKTGVSFSDAAVPKRKLPTRQESATFELPTGMSALFSYSKLDEVLASASGVKELKLRANALKQAKRLLQDQTKRQKGESAVVAPVAPRPSGSDPAPRPQRRNRGPRRGPARGRAAYPGGAKGAVW